MLERKEKIRPKPSFYSQGVTLSITNRSYTMKLKFVLGLGLALSATSAFALPNWANTYFTDSNATWNSGNGTLIITNDVNWTNKGKEGFYFQVPNEVKTIHIAKGKRVTGGFVFTTIPMPSPLVAVPMASQSGVAAATTPCSRSSTGRGSACPSCAHCSSIRSRSRKRSSRSGAKGPRRVGYRSASRRPPHSHAG